MGFFNNLKLCIYLPDMNNDNNPNPNLMSLEEISAFLQVKPRTIYKLIRDGQLPAIKIGKFWRFSKDEVEKYLTSKKFRFGMDAMGHHFFHLSVLEKYRQDNTKYYINEQANDGWVGNIQQYHDKKQAQVVGAIKKSSFADVHYRQTRLNSGLTAIVLTPEQYESLPYEEEAHWRKFIMQPHDIGFTPHSG